MNLSEANRSYSSRYAPDKKPIVYVLDDDDSVRESLEFLIRRAGWQPSSFASAEEFLAHPRCPMPSCLLLDLTLPDLGGLEVQELLAGQGEVPIIFITGYGDVPTTVRAMKAGAMEFLLKPFCDDELLSAIPRAFEISANALRERAKLEALRGRYASLSPREREVMAFVVFRRLSKRVAVELGITVNTVKVHRCNLMRKMQADSFAELADMAARLGVFPRVVSTSK